MHNGLIQLVFNHDVCHSTMGNSRYLFANTHSKPSYIATVEVRLRPKLTTRFDAIRNQVQLYITRSCEKINLASELEGWGEDPLLAGSVESIFVCESVCPMASLPLSDAVIQIHVYQPSEVEAFEEFTNSTGAREDTEDTTASTTCELPNRSLEGLWNSLIYSDNIKIKLLDYIHATFVLSDANIDCTRSETRPFSFTDGI
jgi:hypothetical protein